MINFKIDNLSQKEKIASNGYVKLEKLPGHCVNVGTVNKPLWRNVHHIMKTKE